MNPFKKTWNIVKKSETPLDGMSIIIIFAFLPIYFSIVSLKNIIFK